MRYLLDTCALIWLGMGGGDLSADAMGSRQFRPMTIFCCALRIFRISIRIQSIE